MLTNLENSAVATGLEKVFILILNKGSAKDSSSYCTIALISQASTVMLKILQVGFNSMWTDKFLMFKLDLAKEKEGSNCQHALSHKKQENFRKTSASWN